MNNLTITNDYGLDEVVVDSDMILVIELEEIEKNGYEKVLDENNNE